MYKKLFISCLSLLLLCACHIDSKKFKLSGRMLNMNQGEFYIYDDDGMINGLDTIKVRGGRFSYEMKCVRPTTLMLVFPNFSQQPIFAEPGESVDINGDASHLKELEVKGTANNKLMTEFRAQVSNLSAKETRKQAAEFISQHPNSPVSLYLLRRYYITASSPDFKTASRLIKIMLKGKNNQAQLKRLATQVKNLENSSVGANLPKFIAYDMHGKLISSSELKQGLVMLCTWASWDYESVNQLRNIKNAQRKHGNRLKVISFCVNASRYDCESTLRNDSVKWPNVCDGMMFESKPLQTLALCAIPDNILVKNGRIIARNIPSDKIAETIDKNI